MLRIQQIIHKNTTDSKDYTADNSSRRAQRGQVECM